MPYSTAQTALKTARPISHQQFEYPTTMLDFATFSTHCPPCMCTSFPMATHYEVEVTAPAILAILNSKRSYTLKINTNAFAAFPILIFYWSSDVGHNPVDGTLNAHKHSAGSRSRFVQRGGLPFCNICWDRRRPAFLRWRRR
jgi:hypothetical protein